jgi:hypothetical protein
VNDRNMCPKLTQFHTNAFIIGELRAFNGGWTFVLIFSCCASLGGLDINH